MLIPKFQQLPLEQLRHTLHCMQLLLDNGVEHVMDVRALKHALQEHIDARERRLRRNKLAVGNALVQFDVEEGARVLPPLPHKASELTQKELQTTPPGGIRSLVSGSEVSQLSEAAPQSPKLQSLIPERPEGMAVKSKVTSMMKKRQQEAPELWSLSLSQFCTILQHCLQSPVYANLQQSRGSMTMYDLSNMFVIPWSAGTGCSVSVLMNPEFAKPAQLMFSHAWGEDVHESLCAIKGFINREDLRTDVTVWFCVFANYQAEDGYGPSIAEQLAINPFKSVIESTAIQQQAGGYGMCCLHTTKADLYNRLWCVHEMDVASANPFVEVRMAMSAEYIREVERRVKLFSEEGHFTMDTLLNAGGVAVNTMTATCSNNSDEAMLVKAILQGEGGFQGLDRRILELRRSMLPHAIERVLLRAQVLYGDRVEGRIEAIHALVGLSAHAAEQKRQALEIVTRCLKDSDSSVRATAIEAIGKLAERGDQEVTQLLSTYSSDADPTVRYAYVEVLQHLAKKDDKQAVKFIAALLDDSDSDVRRTSIQALVDVAAIGNESALALITSKLEDAAFGVRHSAVQALGQLTKKGDRAAIALLAPLLEDSAHGVRHAAVQVLGKLLSTEDHFFLRLLAVRVLDAVPHVRQQALRTLVQLAQDGNEQAVNCLLAKLEAATPLTVKSAVYAVRPLVHDGDASVIAWVQSNLQHDNWDIRSAAEDVLQQLAQPRDA
mmetsp:Transcript_29191/g.67189  ORF Transcript_29191/g.67189 Transcript_29191/m.67189 type:complete len:720 (+) Transcript_29191:70-2229(+)